MIDFSKLTTTKDEYNKIAEIMQRAAELLPNYDRLTMVMDLELVHNRIGLDLDAMLKCDNSDLIHDIQGIGFNINRRTGDLGNCFLPRFAKQK